MDWHERRGIMSFLLDKGVPEVLRCAQDDKPPGCHPEHCEGPLADVWESPVLDFLTGTLDYAFEIGI